MTSWKVGSEGESQELSTSLRGVSLPARRRRWALQQVAHPLLRSLPLQDKVEVVLRVDRIVNIGLRRDLQLWNREKLVLHPILHLKFFSASTFLPVFMMHVDWRTFIREQLRECEVVRISLHPVLHHRAAKIVSQIAVSQLWIYLHAMEKPFWWKAG